MLDSKKIETKISDIINKNYIFYDINEKRFLKYVGMVINNSSRIHVHGCIYFYDFKLKEFKYITVDYNLRKYINYIKEKNIIYIGNEDIDDLELICISNYKSDFSPLDSIYDYVESILSKKYKIPVSF